LTPRALSIVLLGSTARSSVFDSVVLGTKGAITMKSVTPSPSLSANTSTTPACATLATPIHMIDPRCPLRVKTGIRAGNNGNRMFDSQNQHYMRDVTEFDI